MGPAKVRCRRIIRGMASERPLAVEILDLGGREPVIVDRVTGATVDEAKGRMSLLSLTGIEAGFGGYRVLSADSDLLYACPRGLRR